LIQELEGHKLYDTVLERLPTLCALSAGNKISYSEVVAFHNVIKSRSTLMKTSLLYS
jgi:solute carrier family 25 aspartate/glutamate transporter 12/13